MQRLLAGIAIPTQAQLQHFPDLQNQQDHILARLQHPVAVVPVNKILHTRDIPKFSGLFYADPVDFILRSEMVGKVHQWNDSEKVKHFSLALQKNVLR